MSDKDFKQLRIKILINHNDQHWIGYFIRHRYHKYYKLNGPAIIEFNGSKLWLVNYIYHNYYRPTAIWHNGRRSWYSNG